MQLGIYGKLFLTILLTSILIVIGMLVFTRWSILTGFEQFIEDRQLYRISQIRERLLDEYEITQGWDSLYGNKRLWLKIILDYRERHEDDDDDDHHHEDKHEDREHYVPDRLLHRLLRDRSNIWPPEHIVRNLRHSKQRLPFEMRIMLFDADKEPVFGRLELLEQSKVFPVLSSDVTVGYLALFPGPVVTGTSQLRFLERQQSGLIYIALGVIALSILISLLLSRRLTRPLHAFRKTARELAAGNYESRVNVVRHDELGELAHDINALGESLKANEQARRQWVADIAHELRTPLTVIQSELEALQAGIRPLDRAAVDSLHEDTSRLGRLINDLYELSVTDLGALSYRKQHIDIYNFLADFIGNQQPRFQEANIQLNSNITQLKGVEVHADEQRLVQLFANLMDNSLRYTDAGGELRIHGHLTNNQLILELLDSTPGVPETSLQSLFERLYRVDESRNRFSGGSGLGLAIVKNIVEAHEGSIEAFPSSLGGLGIKIQLPTVKQ